MEPFVMTPGIMKLPRWSVDNLDYHHMVSSHYNKSYGFFCHLILMTHKSTAWLWIFYRWYSWILKQAAPAIICLYCIVGAIPLTDSFFAESVKPSVVNSLSCKGTETRLTECRINNDISRTCGRFEDAEIVCQGKTEIISFTYVIVCLLYRPIDTE